MGGLTAVYDGQCVICNTTRRVVKALDWLNRVEFLDLHRRSEVETRFPMLEYERSMGEIHVIDEDGRVFAGFEGTRRMLRALPLGLPIYAVLRLPIVGSWLGPRLYRFIAKHRYKINRLLGVELAQIQQEDACCEDGVCKLPQH
jgi:predicted DCC family thiol-disulfide oxidoreductase YuxK